MKFSIRDLLLVTVIALSAPTASIAAEGLLDGSFWVVSDAYFFDKPRRSAVGTTFVFSKGKLYWATKDGERGGVYSLTLKSSGEATRFTCEGDRGIGGKGILGQKKESLGFIGMSVIK